MNKLCFQILLRTIFTSGIILTGNIAKADLSPKVEKAGDQNNIVALEFELPDDAVPNTSVGGGVRGDVQFALPEPGATPNTSVGGGVRGDVQFALPGQSAAPDTSVGGGVRGDVQFALPGQSATPDTSVGGGVRGDVQFALPGQSATPDTSVGGGVRGDVQFALPGQSAAPDTSVGGGVRGKQIPLTALVPDTKYGRTVSARPTIFAYLPYIGAQEVFFSIQDEDGNSHYHTILQVPPTGAVISVTLPKSAPELELGKNYLWYFAPIEPGGILRPDNYAVTAWVTRVEADINRQDLASSPVKLATEYAKAGIWYNTLEVLVEAQHSDPKNTTFASEWNDLLEQIGLAEIASKPIAIVKK